MDASDLEARRTESQWVRGFGVVPVAIGVVVLLGWLLHVEALKTVFPGWVTLKANTALCFLLAGIALTAQTLPKAGTWTRILVAACSTLLMAIGALTFAEYVFDVNIGLDELLFREPVVGMGTSHPGRMAPNTALDFVLFGLALLLSRAQRKPTRVIAQAFALIGFLIAGLALVGYLFTAHLLVTVASRTSMAVLTIAGFLALGSGVVLLTSDVGAAATFRGRSLGGTFGRRLLLTSTLAPITIGGAMVLGQRLQLWDAAFQGAVVAVISIVVLDVVIWRSAESLDRIESQRTAVLAELRRLLTTHDDFLSVASHELKTPLTVLKLKVQSLMRKRANFSPERVMEELADAGRHIDRVNALMEMMLDVARVEGGTLDLESEPFDLALLVTAVVARFEEDARRAKTTLTLRAPETLRGTWDRARIDQVLSHLLRNALTNCAQKAVVVELRAEDDFAILRVIDEGCGIDPADHLRIFGRFERASSARHFGGLGLGLWLSQAIVQAHGGSIRVESTPGEGSTFEVRMPIPIPPS